MTSGTLYPTADTWVVVHYAKRGGSIAGIYGPFDNWSDANEYMKRTAGFRQIKSVKGVG